MQVTDIRLYPVKSLAGQAVTSAVVEPWGLAGDRRWGLVDESGDKVTALMDPRLLALSSEHLAGGGVLVRHAEQSRRVHPPHGATARPIGGAVGAHAVPADPEVDAWLTRRVGRPLRLVWQPDPAARGIPAERGGQPQDSLSLAWSSPLVLTTQRSLERLQEWVDETADERGERRAEPLVMERFRPNVVVDGVAPFAEDGWSRVRIGDVDHRVSALCDRCVVTGVDPLTLRTGAEPLRTLAARRRWDGALWFGVRLVPLATGEVRVGDPVRAVAARPTPTLDQAPTIV